MVLLGELFELLLRVGQYVFEVRDGGVVDPELVELVTQSLVFLEEDGAFLGNALVICGQASKGDGLRVHGRLCEDQGINLHF